jgi:hypothetical protein
MIMLWDVNACLTPRGVTPLSSPKSLEMTCLCCKSIWMISFFDQPIKIFVKSLEKMMANEFEISMIGELSYFLGLQIKQMKNDTFVSQGKTSRT